MRLIIKEDVDGNADVNVSGNLWVIPRNNQMKHFFNITFIWDNMTDKFNL